MHTEDRFLIDVSEAPHDLLIANAERVFDTVWRSTSRPPASACWTWDRPSTRTLRSLMLDLKDRLSEVDASEPASGCLSVLGRFDQQETTKFHLDGAPDESLLVLGYEPSNVRSRPCLADYSRCVLDLGIEPKLRSFFATEEFSQKIYG